MKIVIGDLISAAKSGEVNIIAHGCNCQNTMGAGIAPVIAKAFPTAFEADQSTQKGATYKLGTFSVGKEESGLLVYNLYTQLGFWGRKKGRRDLDYNALYNSLFAMAQDIRERFSVEDIVYKRVKVGIPKLGAGLAGGDWRVISRMVETIFEAEFGLDVTLYVLEE